MSLASVIIPLSDFNDIYNHIKYFKSLYSNMHMRESKQVNKKRVLRYLHAMVALPGNQLEGKLSGPDIYCHYKISLNGNRVQINVLSQKGTKKELDRLGKNFSKEIIARVNAEKLGGIHYPKRKKGEFYLKRGIPGTVSTHKSCLKALSLKQLDQNFLNTLQSWNFVLLNPK